MSGDPLASAARHTLAQASEKVAVNAKVDLSGQQISASGDGAFGRRGGRLHLRFDLPLVGSSFFDEIVSGKATWVRDSVLFEGQKWIRLKADEQGSVPGLGLLASVTPTSALALLQNSTDLRSAGKDSVDGVSTTHYTFELDATSQGVRFNSAEAWVDQQNLVRKVKLDLDANVATTGAKNLHTVLTIHYSAFGIALHVTPPPAFEVAG